jgi:hypothetical protein
MCINHIAHFPLCTHTTTSISNITHCRIYNFTGYCFLPLCSRTEDYPADVCPECDVAFVYNREMILGEERWRAVEMWRMGVYEELRGEKEGFGNLDLGGDIIVEKEGFGEKKVMNVKERLSKKQRLKEKAGPLFRNPEPRYVPHRYRNHDSEYYLDSSRAHNFRKTKPAFGNWEFIERSELEGYEDSVHNQDYNDSDNDDKNTSPTPQEKKKKVDWIDKKDGGSLSSLVEFDSWDRPTIVGWTIQLEHDAVHFRNEMQ